MTFWLTPMAREKQLFPFAKICFISQRTEGNKADGHTLRLFTLPADEAAPLASAIPAPQHLRGVTA